MTDLTTLAKALHRVYNDVEEAQAQRFYGEHARDEWENLAPSEVELWTVLAGHVVALRDAARAEQREANAKIARDFIDKGAYAVTCLDIARAIRAQR